MRKERMFNALGGCKAKCPTKKREVCRKSRSVKSYLKELTKSFFGSLSINHPYVVDNVAGHNDMSKPIDYSISEKELVAKPQVEKSDWMTLEEVHLTFQLPKNNLKSRQWRIDNNFPCKSAPYTKNIFYRPDIEKWMRQHYTV